MDVKKCQMGVKNEFTVLLSLESRGKIIITKILVLISIENPPVIYAKIL